MTFDQFCLQMNERQGRRCGHNFTPAECPAEQCAIRDGLREIVAKIDNVVDLGNRLNDPAAIALAMSLALTSIHAKAMRLLSPPPSGGGAA